VGRIWSAGLPQSLVQVDESGRGFIRSGDKKVICVRCHFRRVEKTAAQPGEGAMPFWHVLRIPALAPGRADLYNGASAVSPQHAIEMLRSAIRNIDATYERPVSTSVRYEMVDAVATPAVRSDLPPAILEEAVQRTD
jgi:hypothetical protein